LTADLLPLFAAVLGDATIGCPLPDEAEAAYLLRSLGEAGRTGWLAEQDGRPVGFVLLGADTAGALRRARGGRRLHRRSLLAASVRSGRERAGRVVFGGVLPAARRQGIGRQLWAAVLHTAREQRWKTMAVGPVWSAPAAAFLTNQGAVPIQTAELLTYTP
jgi:GNAT superfamily N-acetyltransferase